MNSYKNFLPDLFFNKLNDIVTSNNFQWYFQEKTVRNKLLEGDDNFMFTHMLCEINIKKLIISLMLIILLKTRVLKQRCLILLRVMVEPM